MTAELINLAPSLKSSSAFVSASRNVFFFFFEELGMCTRSLCKGRELPKIGTLICL